VLPETDPAGARTFFTALPESLIDLAAQNHWPVGFSIGVAVFHSPKANADDAIRHADGLMYRVKNSGKNNILIEEHASDSDSDRVFFAADRLTAPCQDQLDPVPPQNNLFYGARRRVRCRRCYARF
jgi:predicted signal transduction protein with EAL and GGDEF domain